MADPAPLSFKTRGEGGGGGLGGVAYKDRARPPPVGVVWCGVVRVPKALLPKRQWPVLHMRNCKQVGHGTEPQAKP